MRINLKAPTLHAIRILKHMGACQTEDPDGLVMGRDVADATRITHSYFMRVVKELIKGGLVRSCQGRLGGFQLTKELGDITLYDVIEVMEESNLPDTGQRLEAGALTNLLEELSESLNRQLRQVKLSDV